MCVDKNSHVETGDSMSLLIRVVLYLLAVSGAFSLGVVLYGIWATFA